MFSSIQKVVAANSGTINRLISSSFIFSCTMLVGDAIGQYVSPQYQSFDFKRFACVGISGFFVSGPLLFAVNRFVSHLYPGCGRFSTIKRIVISNCLSPLTIAAGIVPSVYLQTRDPETVRQRVINRVPLNWTVSLLLMTPFTYLHSRLVARRLQNITRTTYNVFYSSFLASRKNHFPEEVIIELI